MQLRRRVRRAGTTGTGQNKIENKMGLRDNKHMTMTNYFSDIYSDSDLDSIYSMPDAKIMVSTGTNTVHSLPTLSVHSKKRGIMHVLWEKVKRIQEKMKKKQKSSSL